MIDRKKLVGQHNPCNTSINIKAPLTVGNGEIGFTADITGMQTLYDAYTTVPLCTLTQWGWHTKPVKGRANYTLEDLEMTSYDFCGRNVQYPVKKIKGNEEIYDWLRENPHRLNLGRIRLLYQGRNIKKNEITKINQHLELYQGRLYSQFCLDDKNYKVQTGCSAYGREELGFSVECKEFIGAETSVVIDFPYGSSDITASNWEKKQQHITECILENEEGLVLKRTLDQQHYYCVIYTNGCVKKT